MSLLLFYLVKNLFYTIGDLTYQSPFVYLHTFACAFLFPHIKQFIPYCIMDDNKYSYRNSSHTCHIVKTQNRM